MLSFNAVIGICLGYVIFLFVVAYLAERRAQSGAGGWVNSAWVYTLSLSIYCTAWTFYGAVGYAARSGLEFVTIYLGPTLVMIGWWVILRRLVRIGREQRITSIADLISSRFGKSNMLGVLVTLLAVIAATPYIALQLQSVTLSLAVFSPESETFDPNNSGLWIAVGLAVFTVIFGTRSIDVNERHHGVVTAIAVEAVVKLVALMAVGIFVVWVLVGGAEPMVAMIADSPIDVWELQPSRWMTLTFLAGAAFLCLPRMFQVLVVENADERQLMTASWAFPAYLFFMSLFVVPIAVAGLALLPEGSNPDLFVLTLPLASGREGLATLAFLGGFSSATSMVIVAALALATMVSNHVVMPIWLSSNQGGAVVSGDVRGVLLISRRITIAVILLLGYLYFRLSGGGAALAAIGLISFAGVAQALPALLGGIFWRGANRIGAAAGLIAGFAIWAYSLFLPSFGADVVFSQTMMEQGPWGIAVLRPQALFGITGLDPVVHAVFWSMTVNTFLFVTVSLAGVPTPLERLQGATFVNVSQFSEGMRGWTPSAVDSEDILIMTQRIIGSSQAQRLFAREAEAQGKTGFLPDVTPEFLERIEREMAGSVGAATAHAMIAQLAGDNRVSVEDLMRVADEAQQIMEHSSQLEQKSKELERTARQLRDVNEQLVALSVQKDGFLSQISHELRTPMTSIRAFSEILMDAEAMQGADRQHYAGIISDEAKRLTRLLDDLLDLSVLENGQVELNPEEATLGAVLDRATRAVGGTSGNLTVERDAAREAVAIFTDTDRLSQVFINILTNAEKYCDAENPVLRIEPRVMGEIVEIDFIDNGSGIPRQSQSLIFQKFARLTDQTKAGGAGLGLAICREIMLRLGGDIAYVPGQGGAAFRVTIPLRSRAAA